MKEIFPINHQKENTLSFHVDPQVGPDERNHLLELINNITVHNLEMRNYTNNLLQENCNKIRKGNLTNEILMEYINPGNELGYNLKSMQQKFDFNDTNLPMNPQTVKIILSLFPYISTLKATLKPNTNPELSTLSQIAFFTQLRSLHLTLTDGLTYFNGPCSKITELKLYSQLTYYNHYLLENIISHFLELKSLTICEGNITNGVMYFLKKSNISRLSIKNPTFDMSEIETFQKNLYSFDLEILKLVVTHVPNPANNPRIMRMITQYLIDLPHKNLRKLSITLPSNEEKINYSNLITKLPKLEKLRLFISKSHDQYNAENLKLFLENLPSHLQVTLVYLKSDDNSEIMRNSLTANAFLNVEIIEQKNLYLTYPEKIYPRFICIERYIKLKNQKINKNKPPIELYERNESENDLEYIPIFSPPRDNNEISEADNEIFEIIKTLEKEEENPYVKAITKSILKDLQNSDVLMNEDNQTNTYQNLN